jgi:uncharacterized protein (DUF362 family)
MVPESVVSLVSSDSHYKGVWDSLSLLEMVLKNALNGLDHIILKINLVVTRVPLSTTPVDSVRSFLDYIKPFYSGKVTIVEKSTWGNTREGFEKYGYTNLAEDSPQVELMDLGEDETIYKTVDTPKGEIDLPLARCMADAPFLVTITRPKTHSSAYLTLGLKNVFFGAIQNNNMRKKIHKGMHAHMRDLADLVYPQLNIIDGTIGMEGDGPARGTEIRSEWALASLDALAADSVATHLMGCDVKNIEYLMLLREKGLGRLYIHDSVKIIGEDVDSLVKPYLLHKKFR